MLGERSKRAVALAALAIFVSFGPPPLSSAEVEATTTEPPFDPSTRGNKKYGDPCSTVIECGFEYSICHDLLKTCACHEDFVTNHVDKCGRPAGINQSCTFNQQCEDVVYQTECKNERCACVFEMVAEFTDGSVVCKPQKRIEEPIRTLDPAMIGVLVGMALMFVIICVVLRLFSRYHCTEGTARWRHRIFFFKEQQ